MGRSLFHSKPLEPPPLPLPPPPLPMPPLNNHNAFPIFSKTAGHGESSFMADAYLLWMDFSHERDQLGYWNGFKGRYCIDLLLYLPWYCCTMFKIMITLINDIAFRQDMSFCLYALRIRDALYRLRTSIATYVEAVRVLSEVRSIGYTFFIIRT